MSNAITVQPGLKPEEINLIKETICRDADDTELKLFLHQCQRTGLDPLARQIYAVKRYDNDLGKKVMSTQTSIDGFRLIAERTGKYAGQIGPLWCGEDGEWRDVWLSKDPPLAAKIGVLRPDFQQPCYGVATLKSYCQRKKDGNPTAMWLKMPDVMLAKCAESLALRKAFPHELSGLHTGDELGQMDHEMPAQSGLNERLIALDTPPASTGGKKTPQQWADEYLAAIPHLKTLDEMRQLTQRNAADLIRLDKVAPELRDRIEMALAEKRLQIEGAQREAELAPFKQENDHGDV